MAHINTLETFDNLVKSGVSEQQARAHVNTLEESLNGIATKEDLINGLNNLEKHLKIFFLYLLAGGIGATLFMPLIFSSILKLIGAA